MECKTVNKAIADFMNWPYQDMDGCPYTADELFQVLMALYDKGWRWKIYTNKRQTDSVGIKMEMNNIRFYTYSKKGSLAMYGAIAEVFNH